MSNASDFIADATVPAAAAIIASNKLIADAMGYTALPAAYKTAIWSAINATWTAGHAPVVSAPTAQFTDPVTHSYQGTWNAATNTPTLTSSVGTENQFYDTTVQGTTNLNGYTNWFVGSRPTFRDGAWHNATDSGDPTAVGTVLDCTQAEAQTVFAHHVAHALWLEHTHEFPWRITRYSLEECGGLFSPTVMFWGGWNTGTTPYLRFHGIGHYDIYGTYLTTKTILGAYTHRCAKNTISRLLDQCVLTGPYPSVHYGSTDPSGIISPAQHFSAGNFRAATSLHISRRGCHSMAPLIAALGRSINLPTRDFEGAFGVTGAVDHHTSEFLSIKLTPKNWEIFWLPSYTNTAKGALLTHGDDLYTTGFLPISGAARLAPRGFYNQYIFGQSTATIELQGSRMYWNRIFEHNLDRIVTLYQANDWQYILDTFITPYIPAGNQPMIDRIERDIKARAGEGQI